MRTKKNQRLIWALIVFFALTACVSAYMIVSILINGKQEQNAFEELIACVEQEKEKSADPICIPNESNSETTPVTSEQNTEVEIIPVILSEYLTMHEQNSDFFGWLRIDDTIINYPVMYTPDDPQYYLHRAFDRTDAQSGTPFLDAACYEGCGNYIIYGHHMNNETMFGTLPKYADKGYWEQHKKICFDTLYTRGEYEIIAAFYGKAIAEGDPGFRYYQYTDLTDPAVFEEYMVQVEAAAIYDTGISAKYSDELITLSTCSYHTADGRFVVVAKKTAE